tara:strand:- start:2106 stop:3797 length:1692 start_codon:yes stop_codon:yes gene_type:complete
MIRLTGGQAAIKSLETENVEYVFGLIGSATMEMFDALYDSKKIKFIGVHDERSGVHMADGYARSSGKPGIFLAGQNGPGATNLTTGLAQSMAAYSPVISIAGSLSSEHIYRDAFQEVDQQALFKPITKKTWTITQTKRIPEIFREAFRVSMSPRKGPVQINIPRDILAESANFDTFQKPETYRLKSLPVASPDSIKRVSEMIANAKNPIIIIGGGIKNSEGHLEVLALAEKLNIPIIISPGHGDAISFSHPLNAGQMGPRGNIVASRLAKEADLILALGTRLGFNSTFYSYDNININASIIQVELEPTAIGRYFPIALGILGDAKQIATQINETDINQKFLKEVNHWTKEFQREREEYLNNRELNADMKLQPIQPSGLFKELRSVIPKDAIITMDAGTLCLQATDSLNYFQPKSLFTPLDFGLVGFSYSCGLGIKVANPSRPVISLMGDGGFGMTLSEISTAVSYGINTITLVLNNKCWGAEKAYQRDFFGERYLGADISSPPFDKIAELYGAKGYRVEKVNEIKSVVQEAINLKKPAVIDIMVDPDALYSFRRDSFAHKIKS